MTEMKENPSLISSPYRKKSGIGRALGKSRISVRFITKITKASEASLRGLNHVVPNEIQR